jgi:biopolymer transport protein ExbD
MIDVLLVLLIIFMAITPQQSSGLNALTPQASTETETRERENPVVLEIAGDGSHRVNTQLLDVSLLRERLIAIYSRRSDRVLFVKAAPDLDFGVVARAIDAAHGASVDRVALMPR